MAKKSPKPSDELEVSPSQPEELEVSPSQPEAEPQVISDFEVVDYEYLISGRVRVQDAECNLYYLDPARSQGQFILRFVPQPVSEEKVDLPPEWKKPTKEEVKAASGKIDWG